MTFDNLPGVFDEKLDGNFPQLAVSNAPLILVLGTSAQGQAKQPYIVGRSAEAAVTFGSSGTLVRGMYEVKEGLGENVVLFRMGATAAKLEGIGISTSTGGVVVETVLQDNSAGTDYEMFWDNTAKRLVVKNVDSGTTVYDRDFDDSDPTVDLGEVIVSGTPGSGGVDVGDQYNLLTFAAVGSGGYDITYTAGTDGTTPSRMKLYEFLFESGKLLENEDFDFVVPMDVYLDDDNVADGDAPVGSYSGSYPTAGSVDDMLLYFYAEEYLGEWYFWWREAKASGAPDIYPAGYDVTSPNGVTIANIAFHEVNFAYWLADFCHTISENTNECLGFIGVKPPASLSLKDVNQWVGKLPTYTVSTAGVSTIAASGDNGTGLLGNKFMAGKYGFWANKAGGGFIATDDNFLDGTKQQDRGGHYIDLGKYLSVVGQWARVYNAFDTTGLGYITSIAPTYAGFVSSLDSKSAPTNKTLNIVTLAFRISNSKLDDLAGLGYVFCKSNPRGVVVADAPTAARSDSDYRRLTTVRITKDVLDAVRLATDPFIGEASTDAGRAALQTNVEGALGKLQKAGYIQRYELSITATPAERAAGLATIEVIVVPAFELRQVTVIYSMAAA